MPLPTPKLDDRRFQDIVDEAKRLIPQYCPEWTDHNVSDPGVTLIELFAWMTDLLLYRVNQVPDRMYVKFLELIGVGLRAPEAAYTRVQFILSRPIEPGGSSLEIGPQTEVSTMRTERQPAIVFTTQTPLILRPPRRLAAFSATASQADRDWSELDLDDAFAKGDRVPMFAPRPTAGDAFYLLFEEDLSDHVLAMDVRCVAAGWAGIRPDEPPWAWEVWTKKPPQWSACDVERDGTAAFNQPTGTLILHLKTMERCALRGREGYWLRCRITRPPDAASHGGAPPQLLALNLRTLGGFVGARHEQVIERELLGVSSGEPGQSFRLLYAPVVLKPDSDLDRLAVFPQGSTPAEEHTWRLVQDFAESDISDRVYTLDAATGEIRFGPALKQPDGSVYRFGAVPPAGHRIEMLRYRTGGGAAGNVASGSLQVIRSSLAGVARVTNPHPATDGRDLQSLEDAKLRAPLRMRTQQRAVTADDYVLLAEEIAGVARAACFTPELTGGSRGPRPGEVHLCVVPSVSEEQARQPGGLALPPELRASVMKVLDDRRPLGITLHVDGPAVIWVRVRATVRAAYGAEPRQVETQVARALTRYLHPLLGGPASTGWPFGQPLHLAELFAVIQRVEGVQYATEIELMRESEDGREVKPAGSAVVLRSNEILASRAHEVTTLSDRA